MSDIQRLDALQNKPGQYKGWTITHREFGQRAVGFLDQFLPFDKGLKSGKRFGCGFCGSTPVGY